MPGCLAPLDPAVDVSIVIVNWNTCALLKKCLSSLRQSAQETAIETIVVDNHSHDGSAGMVQGEFSDVHLIVNPRNNGFALANNQGLGCAHGRYALLLNSDTVALPGAISAMVRYMDEHPRVGILGPRLLNADHSLQTTLRDTPRLFDDVLKVLEAYRWPLLGRFARAYFRRTSAVYNSHRATCAAESLTGACLMLRREAIEEVGGLDPRYYYLFEDVDLCYRFRQRGWLAIFYAGAEVIHLGSQSSSQIPAGRAIWHFNGLLQFYHLHRSRTEFAIIRASIALTALAHLAWFFVRWRHSAHVRPLFSAYAKILARGITGRVR